ncbi:MULTISPECIES: MFS transporter [Streptomyces]|uniref:MFS transporter n=1 Tax=Streptomyces bangladeshensis TaxID=295352 RepID=A0ABN3BZ20_9ACTN|nr:putative MFS-type transporter EfpA [Streptomyces reticuli]
MPSPEADALESARRADLPTPPAPAGALALLATAQLLIGLDYSIVYVALPVIDTALGFSAESLQWVVSAYAVFFAGLLLVCGRLVDTFGARGVFLGAAGVLAAASLGAGLCAGSAQLIVFRALQGAGAAALAPATLSLLTQIFPPGPRQTRALTVWSTTGAAGLAVGVLGGGVLTQLTSWRWIFLAVAVVAAAMAVAGLRLPRPGRPGAFRADLSLGRALLATAAVLLVVLWLTRVTGGGWGRPAEYLPPAVAAVCAAGFVRLDRRSGNPMVPRALLRRRPFVVACAAAALFMASFGAEFYVVTLLMHDVHHYSALMAGVAFLPLAATAPLGSAVTGRLTRTFGALPTLVAGFAIGAAGVALLLPMTSGGPYALTVLPGLVVSGVGQGIAYTAAYGLGTSVLDEQQGVGSALITTVQYFGGSVGLAVLVSVMGETPSGASARAGIALLAAVALAAVVVLPVAHRKH